MARRASFGRYPRTAPSLTSTLISIAREMQNQRAENIMSAWQKGGTFEGQPATDERVLGFWKARLKNLDKRDPLANLYRNQVTQLDYTIHESKMTAKYANGKATDMEMVNFYRNWSGKVPKNSEFYRSLQRDAGQYLRAAKAKSEAAAKRLAEEKYQREQQGTYDRQEKVGNFLTAILDAAQRQGHISDAADLTDPAALKALFDKMSPEAKGGPNAGDKVGGGAFAMDIDQAMAVQLQALGIDVPRDGTSTKWTGIDIMAALTKLDPNQQGLTYTYYKRALREQIEGQQERAQRAKRTSHISDYNSVKSDLEGTTKWAAEVAQWPTEQKYVAQREQFDAVWQDPNATPDEKMAAMADWTGWLQKTAADPKLDESIRSSLLAEATGKTDVPSVYETLAGGGAMGGEAKSQTDIAETWAFATQFNAESQAVKQAAGMAAGTGVNPEVMWVTGDRDPQTGAFTPRAGGANMGAAPLAAIQAATGGAPVTTIMFPQKGGATPMVVIGTPVNVVMKDAEGKAIARAPGGDGSSASSTVGYAFTATWNGRQQTIYQYQGSDGKTYYTKDAPWSSKARVTNDGKSVTVDMTPAIKPLSRVKFERGETTDLTGSGTDESGQLPIGLAVVDNPDGSKSVVYNPSLLTFNSDPVRQASGPDAATDFLSPSLAFISGDPNMSNAVKNDPAFKNAVTVETTKGAIDASGAVDQKAIARANAQQGLMLTGGDILKTLTSLWDRGSTEGTVLDGKDTPVPGAGMSGITRGMTPDSVYTSKLPSDSLRDDNGAFGVLAKAFIPMTNLFKSIQDGAAQAGIEIKAPTSLKVPSLPTVNASTGFVEKPTVPTQAPSAMVDTTPAPTTQGPTASTPTYGSSGPGGGGGTVVRRPS